MLPQIAILDPILSLGLPKNVTAGSGMDALAHCIEAFSSPFYHPMAEGTAVEGIRLVKENLLEVYNDDVINRVDNDPRQSHIMEHFRKHGFNKT